MARVLLTRRIPSSVLRLSRSEHTRRPLRRATARSRATSCCSASPDKDALICLLTDRIDARGARGRAGAEDRRQHRRRLRQHRRRRRARSAASSSPTRRTCSPSGRGVHLGADPRHRAARRRRRSAGSRAAGGRAGRSTSCSARSSRQAARHHRRGPHRPRRRGAAPGLRHDARCFAEGSGRCRWTSCSSRSDVVSIHTPARRRRAPDRQARAGADEALRAPRQHRARTSSTKRRWPGRSTSA